MELTCKKCQFVNTNQNAKENDPCPKCGAIYAKVDAFLALKAKHDAAMEAAKPAAVPSQSKPSPQKPEPQQVKPPPFQSPPQAQYLQTKQQSQLINCPACGATMSKQAKACPNCGHPIPKKSNLWRLVALTVVLVALAQVGLLINQSEDRSLPATASNQYDFVKLIDNAKYQWEHATTSIRREATQKAILQERNEALCTAPATVTGWTGTVKSAHMYLGGLKAGLSVSLNDHITLRTEGDMQNEGSKISKDTPLFDSVSNLEKGQSIIFSGRFIRKGRPCLVETSLTDDGGMTDPAFEFIFTEVKPL